MRVIALRHVKQVIKTPSSGFQFKIDDQYICGVLIHCFFFAILSKGTVYRTTLLLYELLLLNA